LFAFVEAAWNAGMPDAGAEATATTADRVYERTDARHIFFDDKEDPFSYRIPGIANEFWPVAQVPAGGQNYGWGATLPMNIIRSIVGFRETSGQWHQEFSLTPCLPASWVKQGKQFVIRNLHYQDATFDVTYHCEDKDTMRISLAYRSIHPIAFVVLDKSGREMVKTGDLKTIGSVEFRGQNRLIYGVRLTGG